MDSIRNVLGDYLSKSGFVEGIEAKIGDDYETALDSSKEKEQETEYVQRYRISGSILAIHGKEKSDTDITTDDKVAFQDTLDEFTNEVSDLVDFNQLNVYPSTVEWSGKITELDVEFFYSIGENNGIYVNGTMTKIDDEYLEFLVNLRKYYEKFKSKWSKVIAVRKKTPEA